MSLRARYVGADGLVFVGDRPMKRGETVGEEDGDATASAETIAELLRRGDFEAADNTAKRKHKER